tara:strand:+ start:91 stop:651 length:561 start_codon:yes stop_codon:yes gene_type:complete
MRIISGHLKGKKINYLKNSNTRPLKDSVKENIFNIIKHSNYINVNIENSNILDLYSGIGSFGIESISRGAQKVTFVEQDFKAIKILKNNLFKLSINDKVEILNNSINDDLIKNIRDKYQIFFLDPPFSDTGFLQILKLIKKYKIFKKKHIIIIHREKKSKDAINDFLKIIDTKQYGRSKIIFGIFN